MQAMLLGEKANALGRSVILDPVGASNWLRLVSSEEAAHELKTDNQRNGRNCRFGRRKAEMRRESTVSPAICPCLRQPKNKA